MMESTLAVKDARPAPEFQGSVYTVGTMASGWHRYTAERAILFRQCCRSQCVPISSGATDDLEHTESYL